jgi:hypothetical protein
LLLGDDPKMMDKNLKNIGFLFSIKQKVKHNDKNPDNELRKYID